MRCNKSSNESRPPVGTTISPSRTKLFSRTASAPAMTSGKYRLRFCPDYEWMSTCSPSRTRRQRKPSHFGSYSHSSPIGMASTERASMASIAMRRFFTPLSLPHEREARWQER